MPPPRLAAEEKVIRHHEALHARFKGFTISILSSVTGTAAPQSALLLIILRPSHQTEPPAVFYVIGRIDKFKSAGGWFLLFSFIDNGETAYGNAGIAFPLASENTLFVIFGAPVIPLTRNRTPALALIPAALGL